LERHTDSISAPERNVSSRQRALLSLSLFSLALWFPAWGGVVSVKATKMYCSHGRIWNGILERDLGFTTCHGRRGLRKLSGVGTVKAVLHTWRVSRTWCLDYPGSNY
jgi:hypothetical protein